MLKPPRAFADEITEWDAAEEHRVTHELLTGRPYSPVYYDDLLDNEIEDLYRAVDRYTAYKESYPLFGENSND